MHPPKGVEYAISDASLPDEKTSVNKTKNKGVDCAFWLSQITKNAIDISEAR